MPRDPRRDSLYLADIVEACQTIHRWLDVHGHRWNEDDLLRNAVLRQLMVIGEASACLSENLRAEIPEIPWREIRGFRNQAVHAYFSLDWAIVWEVVEINVPDLERYVMTLLDVRFPQVATAFRVREEMPPSAVGRVEEAEEPE